MPQSSIKHLSMGGVLICACYLGAPLVDAAEEPTTIESRQRLTQTFKIPEQSVDGAMAAFSLQTRIQVLVAGEVTRGLRSPGLEGQYTVEQALDLLLKDTQLKATFVDPNTLTLEKITSRGQALELGLQHIKGVKEEASDEPYKKVGSSVYIDEKTLHRLRGSSPGDMLKGVAGVQVGDNRNGNALDVNIRGIQGQNRVPVLVDGSQQSVDVYRGYAGVQQRSYLDPDLISTVTVDKGPNLDANSGGAIGGTVNMKTIGVDDILRDGQEFGLRLRGGTADNSIRPQGKDQYYVFNHPHEDRSTLDSPYDFSGSLAAAWRQESFDLVAAYSKRRSGNYFSGRKGSERYSESRMGTGGTGLSDTPVNEIFKPGEEILDTHSLTESTLLKGTLRLDDAQTLELGYRYYDSTFGEIMPSQLSRTPPSSEWVTYTNPENTMTQHAPGHMRINTVTGNYRFKPENLSWVDLKVNGWFTRADSRMFNSNPSNTPLYHYVSPYDQPSPDTPNYKLASQSSIRNDRWAVDVSNKADFTLPVGGELTHRISAAYQHEESGPGPGSKVVIDDLRANRYIRSGTREDFNWTTSLEWKPIDPLTLMVGGRWSQYSTRDHNRQATVTGKTPVEMRNVTIQDKQSGEYLLWHKWHHDAAGNYSIDSLRNTPYRGSTVGEALDLDAMLRDGNLVQGETFEEDHPSSWSFGKPIKRKGRNFAPQASIAFNVTDNSLLYVKYAEAYRLPSLFESTLGNRTSEANSEPLTPEKIHSWELGAAIWGNSLFNDRDKGALKAAYFHNSIDNTISRHMNDNWGYDLTNAGTFTVEGYELQAKYDTGWMFADFSGTYYLRTTTCDSKYAAKVRQKGGKLANTPDCVDGGFSTSFMNAQNPPKISTNLTVGTRLFDESLELGARMVRSSGPVARLDKPWHTFGYTGNQKFYVPTKVFDLFASWDVNEQVNLGLTVNNLTDQYYLDPLAMSPMPAPGRTVRADFTWKL